MLKNLCIKKLLQKKLSLNLAKLNLNLATLKKIIKNI
jgi:hypothetical protein